MLFFILNTPEGPSLDETLEFLYIAYRQLLYKEAYRILRNEGDAQDCLAETFIKIQRILINSPGRIDLAQPEKTRNYLLTIVQRQAIDQYNSRKKMVYLDDLDYEVENTIPLVEIVDANETRRVFEQTLRKMDKKYKDPFLYMHYFGLATKEIAALMNISEGAVRTRIHRAKVKLNEALGRRNDE